MINAKLLNAFIEVADLGSFRLAADRLHRSQSAVSMQIRDLEEQLGVILFKRDTRNVSITPEGECLREYVKRAMRELDKGLDRIKILSTQHRSHIRVACVPSVTSTRLPMAITSFQQEYPSIKIEVFELLAKEVHDAISKKVADIGIAPIEENTHNLVSIPLFIEPVCAVFAASMRPRSSRGITLKELREFPIMTVGKNTVQRDALNRAQAATNIQLKITHQFAHAQTLLSMVSAGLGVAIVPEIAMEIPGYTDLCAYPIVNPPMIREVAILTRKDDPLTSMAIHFADTLKQNLFT